MYISFSSIGEVFFLPVWPSEVFQSSVERQSPEAKFQILIPTQKNCYKCKYIEITKNKKKKL